MNNNNNNWHYMTFAIDDGAGAGDAGSGDAGSTISDVMGRDIGGSDALDGNTEGLTNVSGGEAGGPIISDETGPDGGIAQVTTTDGGVTHATPATENMTGEDE